MGLLTLRHDLKKPFEAPRRRLDQINSRADDVHEAMRRGPGSAMDQFDQQSTMGPNTVQVPWVQSAAAKRENRKTLIDTTKLRDAWAGGAGSRSSADDVGDGVLFRIGVSDEAVPYAKYYQDRNGTKPIPRVIGAGFTLLQRVGVILIRFIARGV